MWRGREKQGFLAEEDLLLPGTPPPLHGAPFSSIRLPCGSLSPQGGLQRAFPATFNYRRELSFCLFICLTEDLVHWIHFLQKLVEDEGRKG